MWPNNFWESILQLKIAKFQNLILFLSSSQKKKENKLFVKLIHDQISLFFWDLDTKDIIFWSLVTFTEMSLDFQIQVGKQ